MDWLDPSTWAIWGPNRRRGIGEPLLGEDRDESSAEGERLRWGVRAGSEQRGGPSAAEAVLRTSRDDQDDNDDEDASHHVAFFPSPQDDGNLGFGSLVIVDDFIDTARERRRAEAASRGESRGQGGRVGEKGEAALAGLRGDGGEEETGEDDLGSGRFGLGEGGGCTAAVEPVVAAMMEKEKLHAMLKRNESFLSEAHLQSRLAWPMMATNLLQNLMTIISLALVGHLGELPLAAASIATSLCNVTGHILLQGLASGLETLCGQAYGAGHNNLLGLYLQRALLILLLCSLPMALLWLNVHPILLLLQQSPAIAALAGTYARYLLPSLFANVFMQCLERYLQAQNLTFPMALAALTATLLHIPISYSLIFPLGLGVPGAALAVSISFCVNLIVLLLYVRFSPSLASSWSGFSWAAFTGWGEFLHLALPSTVMLCLEYWSFDIMTLMAGLLPNPELQVSALSIILNTSVVAFVLPYGFGVAASTRVANELGAGRPRKAQLAARAAVVWSIIESLAVATLLLLCRDEWGMLFTNSADVISYVADIMPIFAVSVVSDAVNAILSGVVRGCGYQQYAMFANMGAYYACGLPLAALFGFAFNMGGMGLWLGLTLGTLTQLLAVAIIIARISWKETALNAQSRFEVMLASTGAHLMSRESVTVMY